MKATPSKQIASLRRVLRPGARPKGRRIHITIVSCAGGTGQGLLLPHLEKLRHQSRT